MLIIDTNTLYYAFGLSSHYSVDSKTIIQAIDNADDVSISSIAFAEFIVKYHKHAGIIRKVCSFMRQHHIRVTTNKYIPFKTDIVKQLSVIKQTDLDGVFQNLLTIKADIESRFATTVFFAVLFSETIFECNLDPCRVPDCIFDFFSVVFKDSLTPLLTALFKQSYREAYTSDDAENIIRHIFYNYLNMFISLCVPLCKHVIEEYDAIPDGELVDIPGIIQKYSDTDWADEMIKYQARIAKHPTPAHFIKSKGLVYGKGINDKHLSALLSGLDASFQKTIGTSSITEYLYSIVSNTLSNGGAFRKNDINDALILSELTPQDVILTFDNRMILHMNAHSDSRLEYKNSVALINSL